MKLKIGDILTSKTQPRTQKRYEVVRVESTQVLIKVSGGHGLAFAATYPDSPHYWGRYFVLKAK